MIGGGGGGGARAPCEFSATRGLAKLSRAGHNYAIISIARGLLCVWRALQPLKHTHTDLAGKCIAVQWRRRQTMAKIVQLARQQAHNDTAALAHSLPASRARPQQSITCGQEIRVNYASRDERFFALSTWGQRAAGARKTNERERRRSAGLDRPKEESCPKILSRARAKARNGPRAASARSAKGGSALVRRHSFSRPLAGAEWPRRPTRAGHWPLAAYRGLNHSRAAPPAQARADAFARSTEANPINLLIPVASLFAGLPQRAPPTRPARNKISSFFVRARASSARRLSRLA